MDKETLEGLLFIAAIVIIGGCAILKFCLDDYDEPSRTYAKKSLKPDTLIMVPWCMYCQARVSEDHDCPNLIIEEES